MAALRKIAFVFICLSLPALLAAKKDRAKTFAREFPRMEYVGVYADDSSSLFLLADFPKFISLHSDCLETVLRHSVYVLPDTLCNYRSSCRYFSYIKILRQHYAYDNLSEYSYSESVRISSMACGLLAYVPLNPKVWTENPPLRLSVDYTICVYDTLTHTTLVMQPFTFDIAQSRRERRRVQIMQPEGIPVKYPLIDKLHEALLTAYDTLCRKLPAE